MTTLYVRRHAAAKKRCWSASLGKSEGSTQDWSGNDGDPRERDLEIRAYYRGQPQGVSLWDVIYLRADHKYVSVHHLGGILLVERSLRAFERDFPDLLLRIHRNALVARSRLFGFEKRPDGSTLALLMDCDETPVVSRRHLGEVRRWLRETYGPNHSDRGR